MAVPSIAAVPRSRVLDLMKVQSRIFNTVFNPTQARLGTKILRQRLKGPILAAYYPRRIGTLQELEKRYPDYESLDREQMDWEDHVAQLKARGKGAPKKARTAPDAKARRGKKK
ncbi:hypothetical protein K490DRAFT_57373 [Saccharata proteae CBS 121410]|uniref:Small ribosomal subunit protein mS33 n=1 Tax=Saccharata proteae CBS 121410 TaxID=1314787 RepID=A0A9P4HVX7_9PEZI|nr:hypothetical protein K490DRAFT_57373 [Saccharata proteae CBS 121410]